MSIGMRIGRGREICIIGGEENACWTHCLWPLAGSFVPAFVDVLARRPHRKRSLAWSCGPSPPGSRKARAPGPVRRLPQLPPNAAGECAERNRWSPSQGAPCPRSACSTCAVHVLTAVRPLEPAQRTPARARPSLPAAFRVERGPSAGAHTRRARMQCVLPCGWGCIAELASVMRCLARG